MLPLPEEASERTGVGMRAVKGFQMLSSHSGPPTIPMLVLGARLCRGFRPKMLSRTAPTSGWRVPDVTSALTRIKPCG